MTTNDIIRMAREAGIPIETDWAGRPMTLVVKDGGMYLRGVDDLERFAALVAAAERDRICAAIKAADDKANEGDYMLDSDDCISVVRGTWMGTT
jgi:hypothetical protein